MADISSESETKTMPSATQDLLPQPSSAVTLPAGPGGGGFLDRTLRSAWQAIAGVARGKSVEIRPDLPDADVVRLKEQILACLELRGGEVSARARAAALGQTYLSLNSDGRRRFLNVLASETQLNPAPIDKAVVALGDASDQLSRQRAERALRAALRSPRLTLYRRFTSLPQGVKFLVDLRADVLEFRGADPSLDVLDDELMSQLVSWFDIGFLELRRIEWNSPASLLEKLIEYEAVHRISGWDDLKNRLGTDRRCFAFFHPRMPEEPLIFVWVALVKGLSDNIQVLLDTSAPVLEADTADAAIFYSISNAQAGLRGISFGDFLIKRVVDLLAEEFANLNTFSTLSPVPLFSRFLKEVFDDAITTEIFTATERKSLGSLQSALGDAETLKGLLYEPGWEKNPEIADGLKAPLLRLCATYLSQEKRGDIFARDPVAHFHLSNGARIERLNWLADTSGNGVRQSSGVMVNYLYKLNEIEANHESYKGEGKITMSSSVQSLLKKR